MCKVKSCNNCETDVKINPSFEAMIWNRKIKKTNKLLGVIQIFIKEITDLTLFKTSFRNLSFLSFIEAEILRFFMLQLA